MTIMSDNWIKKMSLEQGMIEPFIDGQKKKALFHTEFLLMVMMQGYLKNLKSLRMLILQ